MLSRFPMTATPPPSVTLLSGPKETMWPIEFWGAVPSLSDQTSLLGQVTLGRGTGDFGALGELPGLRGAPRLRRLL